MSDKYILSLDQGTTSSRAIIFDHNGEIDFSNGVLNSFTFEHLSRVWTDKEWEPYLSGAVDTMPDAVLYDYVGGTYTRTEQL